MGTTRKATTASKTKARAGARGKQAAVAPAVLAAVDPALANLAKFDHIVVLMMENRSFDHMLGYLSLEEGMAVDGLKQGMSNSYGGKAYAIRHMASTTMPDQEDPCHKGTCVSEQLSNGNGGFVANFARTHPQTRDPGIVMGYYNRQDLPTYDFLARQFCVCDRWFCPVPGETWPNRLYAMTGRCDGSLDNKTLPNYFIPSFVRHLDAAAVSWNWFGGALTNTLHLTDPRYRVSANFKSLDRDFYQAAMDGTLPAVSWIDPDFGILSSHQNDDHPPVDITAGQDLVLKVYHAVSKGKNWAKTLLVVVYDEHGGFYDHVSPGPAADDDPNFRRYGPRVPAFIVSPLVVPGSVSSTVYDHTSIIKTILLRFASAGGMPNMGARVANAAHLGGLLTNPVRRAPAAPASALTAISRWKAQAFKAQFTKAGIASPQTQELNDFQRGLLLAPPLIPISTTAKAKAVGRKSVPTAKKRSAGPARKVDKRAPATAGRRRTG